MPVNRLPPNDVAGQSAAWLEGMSMRAAVRMTRTPRLPPTVLLLPSAPARGKEPLSQLRTERASGMWYGRVRTIGRAPRARSVVKPNPLNVYVPSHDTSIRTV